MHVSKDLYLMAHEYFCGVINLQLSDDPLPMGGPLELQEGVSGSSMDSPNAPKHIFSGLNFASLNKCSSGI